MQKGILHDFEVEDIFKSIRLRGSRDKEKREKDKEQPIEYTAELYVKLFLNSKTIKDEIINNSNEQIIKQNGLSHFIQKGYRFPSTKSSSGKYAKTQQKIFKSLSREQKEHYFECHEAFKTMVFGDSILVKDWKVMFLLLYHKQAKRISFEMQFIDETSYRLWKTGKDEQIKMD
jgi:hypothetical protein